MVNTPIPHSLKSEAKKAAKILREFTIPSAKVGPDKIIPAGILVKAAGLAIITVAKIGFLVTARGGSGIVIAKIKGGGWSAPSAIGIAGLGGGFEVGAEVTDFVIILNRRSAVEAFSKGGNLTLGGNFTIAAGPLGRNIEGDVSVRSPAAIYTYSKTRGLFAGISIEGSYLMERKDANKKFYCEDIRAADILDGAIEPPGVCEELYAILDQHEEMYQALLAAHAKKMALKGARMASSHASSRLFGDRSGGSMKEKRKLSYSGAMKHDAEFKGSWADDNYQESDDEKKSTRATAAPPRRHSVSGKPDKAVKTTKTVSEWDKVPTCQALWSYQAQLPCDLSFQAGDVIEIKTRTEQQDDWWEGVIRGRQGIFPANYTKVL